METSPPGPKRPEEEAPRFHLRAGPPNRESGSAPLHRSGCMAVGRSRSPPDDRSWAISDSRLSSSARDHVSDDRNRTPIGGIRPVEVRRLPQPWPAFKRPALAEPVRGRPHERPRAAERRAVPVRRSGMPSSRRHGWRPPRPRTGRRGQPAARPRGRPGHRAVADPLRAAVRARRAAPGGRQPLGASRGRAPPHRPRLRRGARRSRRRGPTYAGRLGQNTTTRHKFVRVLALAPNLAPNPTPSPRVAAGCGAPSVRTS